MSTAFHDIASMSVLEPLNTVAQDRVIRAKRARPDYRALRKYLASG